MVMCVLRVFQTRTGKNLHEAISALKKESENSELKGLVLDLRNNPGGLLNAAVAVSDVVFKKRVLICLYRRGRN